jgi:hypothetical protein
MRDLVIREALIFASVGLAIELIIVLLLGFGSRTDFLFPVGVSIVGLYVATVVLGSVLGTIIDRSGSNKLFFGGVIVAWLSLVVQALSGSSVEYFRNIHELNAFIDYIVKPSLWVIFLGSVPAVAVGALYSVRIQSMHSRYEKVP